MAPIRLGTFELLREAGAGGMGTVWEGRHRSSGMPVAVKFLDPSRALDNRYAQRFEAEARAIARLRHPRIVQIYDVGLLEEGTIEGFAPDNPYIVMEWIPRSLADLPRPMPWSTARGIVLEILDALAHVHARDVLHRDVKPANVLGRVGRLRLGDFGIAEVVADDLADTALSGTPFYMAPEQFSTSAGVQGPWTDLYAVGCLTYLLSAGRPPFEGPSPLQLAMRHLRDPFPLDGCDDELGAWLARMTAKRPRDRYASAARAARDLARIDFGVATADSGVAAASETTSASQTLGMTTIFLDDLPHLEAPAREAATPATHERRTVAPDWRFAEGLPEHEEHIVGTSTALSLMRYPSIVGREPERDALWERLQDVARNGTHRQVAIIGEPGLGKSRLAAWLRERARELGVARVTGTLHCGSDEPLLAYVRAELGLEPVMDRAVVARRVDLMSDDGLDATSRNAIVSWLDGTLDAAVARDRSHAVGVALGLLGGDAPLVIVAEDYERSTPEVRDDVARLFEAGGSHGTLVVITTQVAPESPAIERLELEPLAESSLARIVENMAGLSPGLVAELTARSRGNPGYARNLVGDLVEQRQLVDGPHGLELRDGVRLESTTTDALWCRRLGGLVTDLGGDALAVVELAAAIGEPVERGAWERVCAQAGVSAPGRVDHQLHVRELVRADYEDDAWSFAVEALRDWTEAEARDAGRWPHWIEACREALPDADAARRARWAFEVGDAGEAAPLYLEAAADAERRCAYTSAERFLNRAEEAAAAVGGVHGARLQTEVLVMRSNRWTLGRVDDAAVFAERAVDLAEEHGWDDLRAEALERRARIARRRVELDRAATLYEKSRAAYERVGDAAGLGRALQGLGMVAVAAGDYARAEVMFRAALDATPADDARALAWCANGLGDVYRKRDELDAAVDCYERALAGFEQVGDGYGALWCVHDLALAHRAAGDLDRAEAGLTEAVRRSRTIGQRTVAPRLNLAVVRVERGEPGRARSVVEEVLRESQLRGLDGEEGMSRICLLPCDAAAGRWDEVRANLEQGREQLGALIDQDLGRMAAAASSYAADAGQQPLADELSAFARTHGVETK